MFDEALGEARRQAEICNACRYCEGYCSVFPAMFDKRSFDDADVTQLANLCHNCRGCYYACQYTEPHEFSLNLPAALAELRHESWKECAWPGFLGKAFDRSGIVMSLILLIGFAVLFWIASNLRPESGEGFYAVMSHSLMVAIFAPAFLLPLFAIAISVVRYWKIVGGGTFRLADFMAAIKDAATMRNLKGGHGDGCNFEDTDRYTHGRRHFHQATLWGFILCFASTCSGTVLHYGFGIYAPYELISLPKILGISGGVLLCAGTAGLAKLKLKADPDLGAARIWGGEMAFVLLLFFVSFTGLALYAATGTQAVSWLLPIHLGAVLTFFLVTPYSKMAHGFYRMAALTMDAKRKRLST
ncbi:MAG: tricarballylate utilization 4Fe-4S protein TcuB [Pseudomonadota bacterium]